MDNVPLFYIGTSYRVKQFVFLFNIYRLWGLYYLNYCSELFHFCLMGDDDEAMRWYLSAIKRRIIERPVKADFCNYSKGILRATQRTTVSATEPGFWYVDDQTRRWTPKGTVVWRRLLSRGSDMYKIWNHFINSPIVLKRIYKWTFATLHSIHFSHGVLFN